MRCAPFSACTQSAKRTLCCFHLTSHTPNDLHNVTACLDQERTELERDDFDMTTEFQVLGRNMSVERLRNVSKDSHSRMLCRLCKHFLLRFNCLVLKWTVL